MPLEFAISSLITVPMAAKARADAPTCCGAAGGAEQASTPKNGSPDAAPPLHLQGSLGRATPYPHLTYLCTKLTYVHKSLHTAQLKQRPFWGTGTHGEKRGSRGPAVLDSTVPSAACSFQLESRINF